jgi:predicted protein tyrosine phosphatase
MRVHSPQDEPSLPWLLERPTPSTPGVQVFGEHELVDLILKGEKTYDHCISIRNPEQEMPDSIPQRFPWPYCLREFKFYDVSDPSQLPASYVEKRIATIEDIRELIEFFRRTRSNARGYTIHCWHGHSRSTAVALAILTMIHHSEEEAMRQLLKVRSDPYPSPNILVLSLFDQELGTNLVPIGKLLQDEYIKGLRESMFEILWPSESIEELPVVDDGGLLKRAMKMIRRKQ